VEVSSSNINPAILKGNGYGDDSTINTKLIPNTV